MTKRNRRGNRIITPTIAKFSGWHIGSLENLHFRGQRHGFDMGVMLAQPHLFPALFHQFPRAVQAAAYITYPREYLHDDLEVTCAIASWYWVPVHPNGVNPSDARTVPKPIYDALPEEKVEFDNWMMPPDWRLALNERPAREKAQLYTGKLLDVLQHFGANTADIGRAVVVPYGERHMHAYFARKPELFGWARYLETRGSNRAPEKRKPQPRT